MLGFALAIAYALVIVTDTVFDQSIAGTIRRPANHGAILALVGDPGGRDELGIAQGSGRGADFQQSALGLVASLVADID